MAELRKYNAAATILFPLIQRGAVDFITTATFAAGDVKIIKDEGAAANTTNLPVHEGNGIYSLALTATELQAARIAITVIDSPTKVWEDQAILVETYGNASAQHEFDLDDGTPTVDVVQWLGVAPTALVSGKVQVDLATWLGVVPAGLVSTRVPANISAVSLNAITASGLDASVAEEIAQAVLTEPIANVEPGAAFRTLYGAVASLVNRARINASGNLEVYKTDDATVLSTLTATTDAAQQPIKELDPS